MLRRDIIIIGGGAHQSRRRDERPRGLQPRPGVSRISQTKEAPDYSTRKNRVSFLRPDGEAQSPSKVSNLPD
jgi:hypothetical protein